jgi:hypothetical protein
MSFSTVQCVLNTDNDFRTQSYEAVKQAYLEHFLHVPVPNEATGSYFLINGAIPQIFNECGLNGLCLQQDLGHFQHVW